MNSSQQQVFSPRYALEFSCIDANCEDTCCQGWRVLNSLPLKRCEQDRRRRLGRWDEERKALRPIPPGTFKPCVIHYLPVNKLSLVTYRRQTVPQGPAWGPAVSVGDPRRYDALRR